MTVSNPCSLVAMKRRIAFAFLLWLADFSNGPSSLASAAFVPPKSLFLNQRTVQDHEETRLANIATTTRGGSENNKHEDDQLLDCGTIVATLFGNLRIPASLIAGASLASAFALPLAPTDGLKLGTVKRVYALFMMSSLSSMLLTVLVSTMCMADITLSPPRYAKTANDYVQNNYALEYMAAKTNFIWGNIVFVVGSMLRMWVFLSCPVFADGVVGIMGSLALVSVSILLEFTKRHTGQNVLQQTTTSMKVVIAKIKKNYLFGVAVAMWVATITYLIAKTPHLVSFLLSGEGTM